MKKFGGTKVARRETLLQSALKNGSGPQNELQTAWDSLGQAKSILHQVDHKMVDLSKPSSADILWHLPDFLFCLVDQEQLKDLPRGHLEDPSYSLDDNVTASPVKRKVSYKEKREDAGGQYDSVSGQPHSNTVVNTDDSCLPASGQNAFAKDTLDISTISAPASSTEPPSSAWNTRSRDVTRDTTRDVTADLTSSTAVRDTDIRFLNDVTVRPKMPVPRETAKPPRFHHVDVAVPPGYSKKKTDGAGRRVTIRDPPDDVRHTEMLQEPEHDLARNVGSGCNDSRMPMNTKFLSDNALSGQSELDAYAETPPGGAVFERKVANGPPAPAHKGFNEPQNRVRASPVRATWMKEQLTFSRAADTDRPTAQSRKTDIIPDYLFPSNPESAKKRDRVTAIGNSEAAKKDIITTNSWRAGAKLTHDLGLTFTVAPKSEGKTENESKTKDPDLSANASLPDIAKKILQDLHRENESTEEKKKRTTKKLYKKKPTPSAEETPKEKPTKVVLYDANDARKYIRKQKEQRRKDRIQKKESELKMKSERQQRLEELSKHQHDAALKSLRKKSANAMNSTCETKMTGNDEESSADDDDDDDDEDDDSCGERSDENQLLDNGDGSMRKKRPETKFEATQSGLPKVFDRRSEGLKNYGPAENTDGHVSDDDMTAQEIVNRFAIMSGLTLEDVVTNYAKYAEDIMQSFIAKDDSGQRSKGSRQKTDEGSIGPKPSSVSSRLEAILHSSKSLQSRLNTETRRFAADPVMHTGANVHTAQRISKDSVFENASSSTGVVFGSNLPGSNHRPVTDSQMRAHSHPGMISSGFVYHVQQSDLTLEQQEALFKKELPISNSKNESCPFYLRPPLGQLTNKMDSPLLIPAKLVPCWNPSVTEADPLSILNIFSKRQKVIRIMNENDDKISREKEPMTPYLSAPCRGHPKIIGDDALSLIPERDSSARDLRKRDESSAVGKQNLSAVHPMESHMEIGDDDSDGFSSVPLIFTQRSDPWPMTPRSEGMTNRSDGVSYTIDFTDAADVTDDENDHSEDQLDDHSVDRSGDNSVDRSGVWSGTKGDDDQFDFKERVEDEALATNSDISSLTTSDPVVKEDDSDFSNVTSVTLDSALLHQQSRSLSRVQASLPQLIGATLAEPVLAPVALEARMSAELNLLDSMDEVLQQVSGMERTRAVALAQQETVALAQVLKARQQSQIQEVEAARVKLEKESLEDSRRLQSRVAEAAEREHDAAVMRIQATAAAISSLQDAMHRLAQTQTDAAQLTADAAKKLAEASAIALESQQDGLEMRQLLTGSATAAASAAVMAVMQQIQSQQRPVSKKERTSISSESQRKSSQKSRRPLSARSDQSAKSEKSGSYRTGASSRQTSEYDSGSETTAVSAKRSRKSSRDSVSTEAGFVAGMDLSRPGSVQSVAVDSDVQTASDMSKVSRKSRVSVVTDKMSEHAKSVATASDVSSEENTLEASSISTERSTSKARSVGSGTSRATEQVESEKDYPNDYDSATTEDELEKSLRDILPSESQRKKIKKNELKLNISSGSTSTNGVSSHKQSPGNDSFDRFNVAMVKQYLKEEAIRHQHKQMLLQLRERALKEKTSAELAWLEQQKQKLRSKGLDDQYPKLSKKQNAIRRKHEKYQEELNRLKAANQLTLEGQKLLLSETHGIDKLQKAVRQVRQRLKSAGAEGTLPDLSITTDEDVSVSLMLPKDEMDAPGKGDDGKSYDKDFETNDTKKKLDRKRLTEDEQRLQRKIARFDKLLHESPRQPKKDLESKHNKTVAKKQKVSPRQLDSARSVATASDALASARSETARSNRLGSVSEDLATDRSFSARNARSSATSVTEEVSTAPSVNTGRSSSQDTSADVKDNVSEVGNNKNGSSDVSDASISEQLSRHESIASKEQKSGGVPSPKAKKSVLKKKRNQLEKDSIASGSDDDFTLNQSVDMSDRSERKGRIEDLTKELKRRKKEAAELKKKQEKKRLKLEEEKLKQKLKDYDCYIKEAKKDLQSPTSAAEERDEQTKSISRQTSTSSGSSIAQEVLPSKLKSSGLEPASTSKVLSGQHKDDDNQSQPNTRRPSISEDVVEDVSLASLSASGEKMLLDLDLGVLADQTQRSDHQSVTPPRSARSEARVPESARTLADIPEDNSLQEGLNKSERSESQAKSKSIKSQASGHSGDSYTEDFSESSATSLGEGLEKQSSEKSAKLSQSDGKTGAAKVAEEENESTDEDIIEEIMSDQTSQVDSEDEKLEEIMIVKDDNSVMSDANVELPGNTSSAKDNDPISAEPAISDKEVKKRDYEAVTNRALDMLLKETFDELVKIKKQKSNIVITKDNVVSALGQNSRATKSYPAANEKEDFLKDLGDKYLFDDDGDWETPTNVENDAATQEGSLVTVEPVATVVPHNKEEVVAMVNSAVDLLWNNKNSCNTSWENVKHEVAGRSDSYDVKAAQSKASYSRLVFDLTAEALCTIYMDESTVEKLPWCLPKVAKGTRHYVKPVGVTAELIKPTVQERVLRWLGLADDHSSRPRPVKKFRRRRGCQPTKSDQLDELVLEDLHEEEGGWVDYSQDELNTKMELADSIFDSMLQETVLLLTSLKSKK